MSSVTIGSDLPQLQWTRESDAAAGARRRLAAHTSGEAVVGMDLLVLAVAVAIFAPHVLGWPVAVFVLGVLAICAVRGQYATRITLSVSRDLSSLALAVAVPLMVIAALDDFDPQVRPFVLVAIASFCLLVLGRTVAYAGIRRARTKGAFAQRVLIVGAGQVAERFADVLEGHPSYGLRPVGLLDDCADESLSRPVLGGIDHLDDVLSKYRIDQVVLAFGVNRDPDLVRVIRSCENADVDMYVVPRFFELGLQASSRVRRHGLGLPPRPSAAVDDAVVVAPIKRALRLRRLGRTAPARRAPLRCARAGRKAHQPGPVYFRQRRIGKNGREVEILKFRSMRVNSESDTQWSVDDDERVTKLGAFMRKTSLDELPQFWNVLRGDMSLVGPRPERPYFVERFEQEVPGYGDRHRVPVGFDRPFPGQRTAG